MMLMTDLCLCSGQLCSHLFQRGRRSFPSSPLGLEIFLERAQLQLEPRDFRLVRVTTLLRLFVDDLPQPLALFQLRLHLTQFHLQLTSVKACAQ